MNRLNRQISPIVADLILLLVAAIWGSTFVIVKDALSILPPNLFLALRFTLAAAAILFCGRRQAALRRPAVWKAGAVTGLLLACGYVLQTRGLMLTTPAKAGFVTGLSVVLVPVFLAIRRRRWPKWPLMVGVSASVIGLGLLSLGSGLAANGGDLLVLGSAVCFALQIIAVGHYAEVVETMALTAVQLLTVAAGAWAFSLFERHPVSLPATTWGAIVFTALLATSLAYSLQASMQRYTNASHTALIFAAEPVFAALFSHWWIGERLGFRGMWGAALIMLGILTAELGPHYLPGLAESKDSA